MSGFAIRCNAFHTPERRRLELLADTLIEVSGAGIIEYVGPADADRLAAVADRLITLPEGFYLLPGLVDLHVHAPQWPQLGKALDVPLEDWLQKHTFPLEARYADTAFAREIYGEMVDALLAHGTTTAVYFATVHVQATVGLAEICLDRGQRALVGKVAMDNPTECPEFYRDADTEAAVRDTRAVIDRIRALQPGDNPLVRPAITPRFLPACTEALLARLGALAQETGCPVQTHCSESTWEVQHGHDRFGRSDTQMLESFGLLATRSVLAHCAFLSTDDRAIIRRSDAAIAHCPLSNVYFAGVILPTRALMDEGLHIGLGTDISGGHSPSMLESARFAVTASRVLDRDVAGSAISIVDSFWLATAGGGEALGMPIGMFRIGFEFDAIAIDTAKLEPRIRAGLDDSSDAFEKIVRRADRALIDTVWVRGRKVMSSGEHTYF